MAINTQLPLGVQPLQIENPVNQLAKVLQIKDMQQGQQMNALKMDEYRRGIEDKAALRSALSAPDADPYKVLLGRGDVKGATDFLKGQKDAAKTEAETKYKQIEAAHKRVDLAGQTMGWLRQNPSVENAQLVVNHLVTNGGMEPAEGQALLAQLQANPQGIAQFADMTFRSALAAKDQLPKLTVSNVGGQTVTQAADPVSGRTQVTGAIQNTQSPDNAASNARMAADAAASRAQSERHFNTTQAGQNQAVEYVQTENGLIAVPKKLAAGQQPAGVPVMVGGQPVAGKPSAATEKEIVSIRQQRAVIRGALEAVKSTPDAFSLGRGMATMAGALPESVAGRFDSDKQRQARSYVFNNVSKVINERAGAAQSAQELARLRSFLPAETDNAEQITSKFNGFLTYLDDMERGTRGKSAPSGGATGDWGNDPLGLRK